MNTAYLKHSLIFNPHSCLGWATADIRERNLLQYFTTAIHRLFASFVPLCPHNTVALFHPTHYSFCIHRFICAHAFINIQAMDGASFIPFDNLSNPYNIAGACQKKGEETERNGWRQSQSQISFSRSKKKWLEILEASEFRWHTKNNKLIVIIVSGSFMCFSCPVYSLSVIGC